MGERKLRKETEKEQLEHERYELLNRLQDALELPMVVLGFIWLVLLVVELIWLLNPVLELISNIIWILFILDFGIKFILAPHKLLFLRNNVLTALSLAVPALRLFRVTRAFRLISSARAARGLRLVKVVGSINRGMRSLGKTMKRRAFGYVLALTVVVTTAGAAGIYALEGDEGIKSYGDALWWTVMLLTSIGSDYFPVTPEGRILCLLLAIYGFAVFGYFTATVASFFIDRDAGSEEAEVAGARQVKALQQEIGMLRTELQAVLHQQQLPASPPDSKPPEG
ncbi:voltage-gated potassium channel [Pontibacter ummariensis]|uniref:Voltage-gated potassium channel n=1 Tax=Pontibacter ummariensis TaxID=1610492 RepID=A0A239JQ01_9BACT|nr:potassium channel family protein [Pontibacter ummariensis]PRY07358.1 voltage-gated potassium channel [Pontibacter ummariensis]SNT07508.1 voltage-gated potassium channel [Pontibacter ummariensis]